MNSSHQACVLLRHIGGICWKNYRKKIPWSLSKKLQKYFGSEYFSAILFFKCNHTNNFSVRNICPKLSPDACLHASLSFINIRRFILIVPVRGDTHRGIPLFCYGHERRLRRDTHRGILLFWYRHERRRRETRLKKEKENVLQKEKLGIHTNNRTSSDLTLFYNYKPLLCHSF